MPYFPKPSLNENDLAIIERGDTAAHSIEAGKYVSWHGRTGKAKAAILQGATLDDSLFDYDEDGILSSIGSVFKPLYLSTIGSNPVRGTVTLSEAPSHFNELLVITGYRDSAGKTNSQFSLIPTDFIRLWGTSFVVRTVEYPGSTTRYHNVSIVYDSTTVSVEAGDTNAGLYAIYGR